MKTLIYYFSATGNSLAAARSLAGKLGDTVLVSIPKATGEQDLSVFDRVGIVYPVYMFGLPLIAADLIKKLKPCPDKYIFAVATFGGKAGSALAQTARLLNQAGFKLSYGCTLKMPGNYTPLGGALPADKQQELFKKAEDKIARIAEAVGKGQSCGIEKSSPVFDWLSGLLYRAFSPKIPVMDKKFWSNDRCNGCGACVRVCPVGNIRLSQARPQWLHHCQQCLACLHWCPQGAIEYGKSTVGKKRYRHPGMTLDDIAGNGADKT